MGKKLVAFSLPALLIVALICLTGCGPRGRKPGAAAAGGGQPITIMDDYLTFAAFQAFNSPSWMPEKNTSGHVVKIHPNYSTFTGVDLAVDSQTTTVCDDPKQTCEIHIWWENTPPGIATIAFYYNPGASTGKYMLTLESIQTPFDQYWGYGLGLSGMQNQSVQQTTIPYLTVSVAGKQVSSYTPMSNCGIVINVQ